MTKYSVTRFVHFYKLLLFTAVKPVYQSMKTVTADDLRHFHLHECTCPVTFSRMDGSLAVHIVGHAS